MHMNSQRFEKETDSEILVRRVLGESLMSGGSVRHRNDWSLAMIFETLKTDGVSRATEAAQHLVKIHPNLVDSLVKLYAIIKNEYGSSAMGKEIAYIYSTMKRNQMESLIDISQTPPMHTTSWMLKRVGEMVDQTAGVVRATQLGLMKYKPVLLLSDKKELSNSAFWPYLADAFEIISDPKDAQAFRAQPIVPRLDTYMMHFNDEIFGHASEYEAPLFQLLHQNGFSKQTFNLKSCTESVAQSFLKKYGLGSDDIFTTLHVREEGYVDSSAHSGRNLNPHHFQSSIDYLIKQGVKVVRIGHPKMTPLKEQSGFVDLTRSDRPSEVDIYLCAKNWFYFGSSSGPYSLANHFGRPSLLIDYYPFGTARPNCFHVPRSFRENKRSAILSFSDLREMDLQTVWSSNVYTKRCIETIGMTESQIRNAVLDILLIGPENLSAPDDVPQALESSCVIEDFNVLFSRRELVVF